MAVNASLVGSGQSTSNTFTTAAGAVTAGDTLVFAFAYDPGQTISSVALSTGDTLTQIANRTDGGGGRLAVYIKQNATAGGSVTATATFSSTAFPSGSLIKCTGVATTGYDASSLAVGTDSATPYTITSNAFAAANTVVIAVAEQSTGSSGAWASSNFTLLGSQSDASQYWLHAIGKLVVAATTAVTPSFTRTSSGAGATPLVVFGVNDTGSASIATLTSATPSGTLGTSTSATLGATTDVTSGTFYGVVDVAARISGITVAQVKAGQNNLGAAPVGSGNASVSTVSPSVSVSGLTSATLYSYAVAQNTTGGDSNVLTGTFTTATASVVGVRDFGPRGALKTLLTM